MYINFLSLSIEIRHQDAALYHVRDAVLHRAERDEAHAHEIEEKHKTKSESKLRDKKKLQEAQKLKYEIKLSGDTLLAGKYDNNSLY